MMVRHRTTVSPTVIGLDLLKGSGLVLLTIVVIWPALWTQPGFTLNRIMAGLMDEETRSTLFFWGQSTDSPGLLFYPVVLALRLSPLVWIGLLGAGITVVLSPLRRKLETGFRPNGLDPDFRPNRPNGPDVSPPASKLGTAEVHQSPADSLLASTCGGLGLIALGYVGLLSLASTKIDRYISLMIPVFAILAAVGWVGLQTALHSLLPNRQEKQHSAILSSIPLLQTKDRKRRSLQTSTLRLALFLATGQLIGLLPHMPYGLTYYNPMLGGIEQAQQVLMIGQGEGLDKMAQWLNQHPEVEHMTVASWYRSVLAAYFNGAVSPLSSDALPDERFWTQSHRVVLYHNQLQRQLPSADFLDYIRQQRSLHTITEQGIEYAIAYPGPIALDSDLETLQHPHPRKFGQRVHLQGYDVDDRPVSSTALQPNPEPHQRVLTLYWTLHKKLPKDMGVYVEVRDRANQIVHQATTPLLGGFYPSSETDSS